MSQPSLVFVRSFGVSVFTVLFAVSAAHPVLAQDLGARPRVSSPAPGPVAPDPAIAPSTGVSGEGGDPPLLGVAGVGTDTSPGDSASTAGPASTKPIREPRRLELGITIAALAEIGILHGGTDNPRTSYTDESVTGVAGPLGGLSVFVGHDVALFDDDASGMALGYLGMALVGVDSPMGGSHAMVLHRHELALAMRVGATGIVIGVGGVFGHLPTLGATVPGVTVATQLGFFAGPVWFGFPLGVDIWLPSGRPAIASETFAFTIGVSTL